MKKVVSTLFAVALSLALAMVSASCDQVEKVASGGGGDAKTSSAKSSTGQSGQDVSNDTEQEANDANDEESEAIEVAQADSQQQIEKIRLSAFTDFSCSKEWTNRDGGLGLRAGAGSGVCRVAFPGAGGSYRVTLMAQLEFDGNPKFKIDVDGSTIAQGNYPMSMGKLVCDCPNWRVNCPDRIVPIDAGVHDIEQGALIEFVGAEVYPCGGNHGAYAKWHELVFTPQE
jgi:hypothetical protein